MMQEQKQIGIKSLYFAMRFNTKMWCDNIIKQTPVYYWLQFRATKLQIGIISENVENWNFELKLGISIE